MLPFVMFGAHPRVSGENWLYKRCGPATVGSSPRERGKLALGRLLVYSGGLIPAWRGKLSSWLARPVRQGLIPA